jgi:hypothetical protein
LFVTALNKSLTVQTPAKRTRDGKRGGGHYRQPHAQPADVSGEGAENAGGLTALPAIEKPRGFLFWSANTLKFLLASPLTRWHGLALHILVKMNN